MDINSPEVWFKSLPIVTRSLLVMLFSSTCLVVTGLLDPYAIVLDWSLVTQKYGIFALYIIFIQIPRLENIHIVPIPWRFLIRFRDAAVFLYEFRIEA